MDKCHFAKQEINYLGHVITKDRIQKDPNKESAVTQILAPTWLRELRQFLGAASWHRRFILEFSRIVIPLTKLLKQNEI